MTGISNSEWQALAAEWQVQTELAPLSVDRLLRRERRRRFLMRLLVGSEALISAAALAGSWVAVRSLPRIAGALVVLAVVFWIAVVWGFAIWNRRGTWHPLSRTVEGFLAVSILRCRRGLVSARFATVVASIQLGATLLWLAGVMLRSGATENGVRMLSALTPSIVIGVIFLVWGRWYRGLMLRKLAWLERQSEEIASGVLPD